MKIFVFTWDRYNTLTTPLMLSSEGIEHTVLCHSEDQKESFINAGRVNKDYIIATGKPKGLAYNRNVALDMMEEGEWAIFLVDDFMKILEFDEYDEYTQKEIFNLPVDTKNSTEWGKKFKKEISFSDFLKRTEESIAYAEKMGINLVGFAGFKNPLFLKNKWKFNCLADGRAWAVKKTKLRFDENAQMIDDICWTVLNIQSGGVLINQWVIPDCERYTTGSFGSIPERMELKKKECAYLVKTYPDYIYIAEKPGWDSGSHVRIKNGSSRKMLSNVVFQEENKKHHYINSIDNKDDRVVNKIEHNYW